MKVFDNTSGKRSIARLVPARLVPATAASLLVSLSAQLLKWQNPGEACGVLLQAIVAKQQEVTRKCLLLASNLRSSVLPF